MFSEATLAVYRGAVKDQFQAHGFASFMSRILIPYCFDQDFCVEVDEDISVTKECSSRWFSKLGWQPSQAVTEHVQF